MDPIVVFIAVTGGLLAGIVNTLAGNGSAITLSILTELIGLPGNLANGTNRVGVLAQGLSSTFSFAVNKKIKLEGNKTFIFFTFIGALLGVWMAVNISNEFFKEVFKFLLIVMLLVTVINPKRWLHEGGDLTKLPYFIAIPLYLALGFYGGFIQMGMGVVFLIVTVLVMRYKLIDANVLKTVIVFGYTIVVVLIFQYKGLIEWKFGLIIAAGQTAGGYLAAEFASKYKHADIWAYRVLIVVIILALVSLFDLF